VTTPPFRGGVVFCFVTSFFPVLSSLRIHSVMIFALQILCILGLVGCGFIARRRGLLSAQGTSDLAHLSVALIYPALIISSVTKLSASDLLANIMLPLIAMGIALTGFLLGLLVVKLLGRIPGSTIKAFLFHCLMNNYMFLPLPLVLFFFGERGVALLVFSSVGYELLLWTLGVFLFTKEASWRNAIRQMFSPPFLTLLGSLLYVFLRDRAGLTLPDAWRDALTPLTDTFLFATAMLGQATVALSMLIAGSRFAMMRFHTMLGWRIWMVSVLRLVAVPLVVLPVIARLPLDSTSQGILMIVAVMPSAMVSIVFSERYGGDSEFIAGALLLTHLWALLTVPLFLHFWF